jgi:hypothetical protein
VPEGALGLGVVEREPERETLVEVVLGVLGRGGDRVPVVAEVVEQRHRPVRARLIRRSGTARRDQRRDGGECRGGGPCTPVDHRVSMPHSVITWH